MGSFYSQLVCGEKPLWFTFWGFWGATTVCYNLAMEVFSNTASEGVSPFFFYSFHVVNIIGIGCCATALISVWRAANKYQGPYIWKFLSKGVAVMNILALTGFFLDIYIR